MKGHREPSLLTAAADVAFETPVEGRSVRTGGACSKEVRARCGCSAPHAHRLGVSFRPLAIAASRNNVFCHVVIREYTAIKIFLGVFGTRSVRKTNSLQRQEDANDDTRADRFLQLKRKQQQKKSERTVNWRGAVATATFAKYTKSQSTAKINEAAKARRDASI